MHNTPGIDGQVFTIVLKKEWFIEDIINYEYKHIDGMYTLIESSLEAKETKRKQIEDERSNREDTDARQQDTD